MSALKSIKKRLNWFQHVSFDKETGFYRFKRFGHNIYIRHPRHYTEGKTLSWYCENIIFHHYHPTANDVVLDLGAGYGEEAIYLAAQSPDVQYIGAEPQPVIYECLSNTFRDLNKNFIAVPYAISNEKSLKFTSHFSYASVGELASGYIDIPTLSWQAFIARYGIEKIDLFKMNIEGAEKGVLTQIHNFPEIKRFIISCHDFRANNGDGEWFRSKAVVLNILRQQGYKITEFSYGIDWADDWIFAER